MSFRDWRSRVQDILTAIDEIQQCTTGVSFEDFMANRIVMKAALYDYMIIGEASRNIPLEVQALAPQIPWRLMNNMRNVVAHEYFQVELEIVWDSIQNDLPLLIPQLQELLNQEAEGN
ncbi:MAG: DUF86 domain-containing protein [Leptolyngbyaceae cyanobacterium RU_5_1]|nr:DUF86 domain-containing protein [Leptolyngbyaceae cyanobacterium RU_5_1]